MALYKLTNGTVSKIRTDKKGVDALLAAGYKLDGEVDEKYEVIDDRPTIKATRKKKADSDEEINEDGAEGSEDDTADSDSVEADSDEE